MRRKKTAPKKNEQKDGLQKKDLATIGIALLIVVLLLFFLNYKTPSASASAQEEQKIRECEENKTRSCYVNDCTGQQKCVDGRWGICELNIICIPGSIEPCVIDSCIKSYKICNKCGSGYSDCLPRDKLPLANKELPP